MKRWQAYRTDLLAGDWQVHSTWSDGRSSILEYCEKARSLGLRLRAGVNFAELLAHEVVVGVKVQVPSFCERSILRYYEEIVLD